MKSFTFLLLITLCGLHVSAIAKDNADPHHYWPQWRGPLATGVAPHADPPIKWSDSKNIRWKIPLPGKGHSTPIVWQDHIFITTAIPFGKHQPPARLHAHGSHDNLQKVRQQEFAVLAINRRDGKILWQRTVHKELPHEGGHQTSSFASASPATDGEHLFAFFGSRGLYCLDFDGQPIWQKNLGEMHTKHAHGEGSSPVLYGDTLIVNWDHEGESFVVALDKHNGDERWRAPRDEVSSWATPIVVEHNQKPQVIVSGTKYIRSYDLKTGKVIWQCSGLSANVVASPVAAHGLVIAASSYVKRAILAIQLDGAAGDISGTDQIVWTRKQGTPYVPSPLLVDDSIYYLRHYQGTLSRVNIRTGQNQGGPFRLAGIYNVYASPVAAANRVYITDIDGNTLVITHDKNKPLEILAQNRLDDRFSASAAIVGQELFLRGENHLYCIATQ